MNGGSYKNTFFGLVQDLEAEIILGSSAAGELELLNKNREGLRLNKGREVWGGGE